MPWIIQKIPHVKRNAPLFPYLLIHLSDMLSFFAPENTVLVEAGVISVTENCVLWL